MIAIGIGLSISFGAVDPAEINTSRLLTEGGDDLTTESGDKIKLEDA